MVEIGTQVAREACAECGATQAGALIAVLPVQYSAVHSKKATIARPTADSMRRYALAIVLSLCLLLSTQLGCSPAHGQQVALYEEQAKTQRDLTDSESAARSGSTDTSREIERLETIARSFRKLPDEELARIGIDLDKPIVLGGEQAAALHKAWAVRQQEFKDMVDGMVKPAEHMASLARLLKTSNGTQEERTDALMELEGLLTDVDNARDFYTIGKSRIGHPESHIV